MDPKFLFFGRSPPPPRPDHRRRIDQLILELKKAFHMTIIVVTHELASAF